MTKKRSGVNRLARADHDVPPARIVLLVVPGHVGIAADGVADEDGVVARGVELAVGLVGHGDAGKLAAQLQFQRLGPGSWTAHAATVARAASCRCFPKDFDSQ